MSTMPRIRLPWDLLLDEDGPPCGPLPDLLGPPSDPLDDLFDLVPAVENFTKNVLMDKIEEPVAGSVVYCGMALGYIEHSGIYVGNGSIISLSAEGYLVKEDAATFLEDVTGDTIYVSCVDEEPVGNRAAAKRAKKRRKDERYLGYDILTNNCHRFSSGCLTGDFGNRDWSLEKLKHTAARTLGADTWRAWDF